ncbi:uncharacterized protein [Watersipora subatra]|uniref:uncharacterized protein n=1 Tax=Watersipora subatra TaxID=2589382 RepID=UPI00355C2AAF
MTGSAPSNRPSMCKNCVCLKNHIIVKKDVVSSVASKGILPGNCPNYSLCCLRRWPTVTNTASSVNVSGMAKNLVKLFGRRAADKDFKKPSVDLVFLIDDSGSILAPQFKVAKEGAATLSQALCPQKFGSGKGEKQVSVALFSTDTKTVLTYDQSQKGAGFVEDTIMSLKQRSGMTSTADALKHVREKVLTQAGNRLNDKDTATIVFVITDGKCNTSPNYSLCCVRKWPTFAKTNSKAVDVSSMASSLLNKFGRRAADKDFKKPSVDLVFLIDDSGSISAPQFKVAKEGAATLSQALCPQKFGSRKGEKQVSVVLFSTVPKTVLTYDQSQKVYRRLAYSVSGVMWFLLSRAVSGWSRFRPYSSSFLPSKLDRAVPLSQLSRAEPSFSRLAKASWCLRCPAELEIDRVLLRYRTQ